MKTVRVRASREYEVRIGRGLLDSLGAAVAGLGAGRAVVVSDDTVFSLYGEQAVASLEGAGVRADRFVFPHGEASKTLETWRELLLALQRAQVGRKDAIVALGGGVVGDLAGFAAATWQRGMGLVQVPTTLLAMVDSSVGGKTAVDLGSGKNQVGSFYQPWLVLCDPDTLSTLPREQYLCGCAEAIKDAVIASEPMFARLLETPADRQIEEVIAFAVEMKRDIVEEDEFDTGRRALLNLGHTIGHAVEASSGFSVLHGQAVAMGMAAIARASAKRGWCGEEVRDRIVAILRRYGLPTEAPSGAEEICRAMLADKKRAGGSIRFVIPRKIGQCALESVPVEEIPALLRDGGIA